MFILNIFTYYIETESDYKVPQEYFITVIHSIHRLIHRNS